MEVCSDNKWGTVCDDGWDIRDATVACTQLENPDRKYFLLNTYNIDGISQ